jgi:hypothetical protein
MVPGRMSVTAEHRPERSCHGPQHHARTKSHPGVRTGRKGKRQNEGTKDDNRPRAHDRSPAGCRIYSQPPSSAKVPLLQTRSADDGVPSDTPCRDGRSTLVTTAADLTVQARPILQSLMKRMGSRAKRHDAKRPDEKGHGALVLHPAAARVSGGRKQGRESCGSACSRGGPWRRRDGLARRSHRHGTARSQPAPASLALEITSSPACQAPSPTWRGRRAAPRSTWRTRPARRDWGSAP